MDRFHLREYLHTGDSPNDPRDTYFPTLKEAHDAIEADAWTIFEYDAHVGQWYVIETSLEEDLDLPPREKD